MTYLKRDITVLYFLSLFAYFFLVVMVNHQQVLTPEEMTVAFIDPLFLEMRLQLDHYSTNFGGHLFYWFGHKLFPFGDLFYGRWWKAIFMSLAPVLFYLIAYKRYELSRQSAFMGALLFMLMPGVSGFAWIEVEMGLELLLGMLAFYLCGPGSVRALCSGFILGFALISYGGAIHFLPLLLLELCFSREQRLRQLTLFVLALLAAVAIPLLWWIDPYAILKGGGDFVVAHPGVALKELFQELFLHNIGSYYFFTRFSAIGSKLLLPYLLLGAILLALRLPVKRSLPLMAMILFAFILYAFTGGVKGMRRLIPLMFPFALMVTFALEMIAQKQLTIPFSKVVRSALMVFPLIVLLTVLVQMGSDFYRKKVVLPEDVSVKLNESFEETVKLSDPFGSLAIVHMRARFASDEAKLAQFALEKIRKTYLAKPSEIFACRPSLLCLRHQ
ncbi:MAG: hypothetical protein HQK52_11800 [Oligoflexia bacterium]|nr:hypothetical protein [Oligoflexia bacterium]